jgi:dTDP-4-amino-4,6-dideoxygalactose transaminase
MIPYLDLRAQYLTIKDEIDVAIKDVVGSCHFVLGEQVEAFESEFAKFCGTEYAVGVNSGTSALHLALLAAGVKAGDEVITVSDTFVATAAAICYTGAIPVFVEIDPCSCTMDPAKIEAAITPRTKVIMPVHLYGACADMDSINEIAVRRNLIVIEDAAQAHGADYRGRCAGGLSSIACFSFYPGKNLGAFGEGGAVTTNNPDYANRIQRLRDHGQSQKYYHDEVGYNYRMEAIQGAVLRVKLRHLEDWTAARRRHAAAYQASLKVADVRLLEPLANTQPAWHIFPVFTQKRDALMEYLKNRGISTGIHYPIPIHLQRGYAHLGYQEGDFPLTEQACNEVLSLPMYAELPQQHLDEVVAAIRDFSAAPAGVAAEAIRAHS